MALFSEDLRKVFGKPLFQRTHSLNQSSNENVRYQLIEHVNYYAWLILLIITEQN